MKRGLLYLLIVLAILLGVQASSQAAAILSLSDGTTNYLIYDNQEGDINLLDGVITFNGSINNWLVNVTTGLTKPVIGSATSPQLDLNSVNVTSGGVGTLTIKLVDEGFTFTGGLTLEVGGTMGGIGSGTVNFNSYLINGPPVLIASLGPFGPGAFADTAFQNTDLNSRSLVLIEAIIASTSTGQIFTSFDASLSSLAVPEPGVMLLLGCGLVGLWGFRRRIKK